jgi:hypothetical protein
MASALYINHTKRKIFKFLKVLKYLEIGRAQLDRSKYTDNWLVSQFMVWMVTRSFRADDELMSKYDYFSAKGRFHELGLLFRVFGAVQPDSE